MPNQQSFHTDVLRHVSDSLPKIAAAWQQQHSNRPEFADALIISVSDGQKRARTRTLHVETTALQSSDWADVFPRLEPFIQQLASKFSRPIIWCRIEWIYQCAQKTWQAFQEELTHYKRNYFRSGLAVPGKREPWLLMTEAELNAYACLYPGSSIAHAMLNKHNFQAYFKARHGSSQWSEFSEDTQVWTFNTAGIFIDTEEMPSVCHTLATGARQWGRRALPALTPDTTGMLITESTDFLARQVQSDGQYIYGYFPCFNRQINTYNSLRHASSTYALLEGYEACREKRLLSPKKLQYIREQIQLALDFLCRHCIKEHQNAAYLVDTGEIIKLGANAVTILALSKYTQVMQDTRYLPLMRRLAQGIVNMQQENGSFVHVLDANTFKVKEKFRIIYYDGEAAFALMRLYGLTKEQPWLDCVERAFDYFIRARHDKAHDHWLSYCSNELISYKPERKYFEFAVNNIKGYLDFIQNRLTTFPTLLELCMAFHKVLQKLTDYPQYYDVLQGFDINEFYRALHTRANYLVNGFFFPEVAMFFKSPITVLHGFFIRHHGFRVRIDDVEHYLSGFVAYLQFLENNAAVSADTFKSDDSDSGQSQESVLSAKTLARITGGQWLPMPESNWQATGLCIWRPGFQPGNLLVSRKDGEQRGGLMPGGIRHLADKGASGIICTEPQWFADISLPKLVVKDNLQAIVNIGRYARSCFKGTIIGVTGSVGKTTVVAMIHQALSLFAKSAQTIGNANTLHGIAWNMASLPNDADYWVLEMAIGKMRQNSQLVRPHIAVVNSICDGHMDQAATLDEVAIQKSMIFDHMPVGAPVIINKDIEQYEIFAQKAALKSLNIISFGHSQDADIQVLHIDNTQVRFRVKDNIYQYNNNLPEHLNMNAPAVFGVAVALNLPLEPIIRDLETFRPLEGRGMLHKTTFNGKHLSIIDDSYNATPKSMQAGLHYLKETAPVPKSRVAILGDIAHLGSREIEYHLNLAKTLDEIQADRVLLCGPLMKHLWESISQRYKGCWYPDGHELLPELQRWVQDGDVIFIKGSMPAKMQIIANTLIHHD